MKRIICLLLLLTALSGCTSPDSAQRVLADQGYTNIEMQGYKAFSCGKGDIYRDGFIATSPSGKKVTGVVCKGAFKGSTIRFD